MTQGLRQLHQKPQHVVLSSQLLPISLCSSCYRLSGFGFLQSTGTVAARLESCPSQEPAQRKSGKYTSTESPHLLQERTQSTASARTGRPELHPSPLWLDKRTKEDAEDWSAAQRRAIAQGKGKGLGGGSEEAPGSGLSPDWTNARYLRQRRPSFRIALHSTALYVTLAEVLTTYRLCWKLRSPCCVANKEQEYKRVPPLPRTNGFFSWHRATCFFQRLDARTPTEPHSGRELLCWPDSNCRWEILSSSNRALKHPHTLRTRMISAL